TAAPTPVATSVAARAATKAKASAKPAAARRYTVRRGDSLWSIARRHGTTVARLKAVNGLRSSTVRPGRRLVVPA
ncbi:MAG: LysM peptidoglycan-binding domain-containing protein, partial [Gemmatimonadaceae bacterium]